MSSRRPWRTNSRLTPVYNPIASPHFNPDLQPEAKWELLKEPPHLPNSVVYLNDGRIHSQNASNRPYYAKLGHPYDRGFTDANYQITGVTNIGRLALPSGFIFQRFMPGGGKSSTDLRVLTRAEATVTAARPGCSRSSLLPEVPARGVVLNHRLAGLSLGATQLLYRSTKGK